MTKRKLAVSVVVPAYNQKGNIGKCIGGIEKNLLSSAGFKDFEIIVAEDGSTDGTFEEAKRIAGKDRRVRVLHSGEKLGRGRAVCRAFSQAKGRIVAYIDADQATETSQLTQLLKAIGPCDLATGSRYLSKSKATRSVSRLFFSLGYNSLVRLLLGSEVSDHQCGFKAFEAGVAKDLCRKARDGHWFWDTEVLVLAQRNGYSIGEIPVAWKEQDSTTVRLGKDIVGMGRNIFRLWLRINFSR